jgi:hypothetical protein
LWEYDRLPSKVTPKTTLAEMMRRRQAASDICGRQIPASDGEHKLALERLSPQELLAAEKAEAAWRQRHAHECGQAVQNNACAAGTCRDNERESLRRQQVGL